MTEDWYARRFELDPGMCFRTITGDFVKLDQRVPGDGTKWYIADWIAGHWSHDHNTIEPSDLAKREYPA